MHHVLHYAAAVAIMRKKASTLAIMEYEETVGSQEFTSNIGGQGKIQTSIELPTDATSPSLRPRTE